MSNRASLQRTLFTRDGDGIGWGWHIRNGDFRSHADGHIEPALRQGLEQED